MWPVSVGRRLGGGARAICRGHGSCAHARCSRHRGERFDVEGGPTTERRWHLDVLFAAGGEREADDEGDVGQRQDRKHGDRERRCHFAGEVVRDRGGEQHAGGGEGGDGGEGGEEGERGEAAAAGAEARAEVGRPAEEEQRHRGEGQQRGLDHIDRLQRSARLDRAGAEDDEAWRTRVVVRLGPDPRLSPPQQALIERDYGMKRRGMEHGELRLETRGALVSYLLQQLRVDTPADHRSPEAQQVVLLNHDEVQQWAVMPG